LYRSIGEFQINGILKVNPVKIPAPNAIPIVVKIAAI